uniref:Uncharacterized protein n=1 Tax=Oryza brachyantha TaxID=4533 RepID=J3N216_ORYBR
MTNRKMICGNFGIITDEMLTVDILVVDGPIPVQYESSGNIFTITLTQIVIRPQSKHDHRNAYVYCRKMQMQHYGSSADKMQIQQQSAAVHHRGSSAEVDKIQQSALRRRAVQMQQQSALCRRGRADRWQLMELDEGGATAGAG